MTLSVFLEAIMMVCFGVSWPASILKTIRAKNPAGKSILFLVLILTGYAAGVVWRIIDYTPVLWLYLVNGLMVGADLGLTLHYKNKLAKKQDSAASRVKNPSGTENPEG